MVIFEDAEFKDRISNLSNDLLGLILSSLTMKEAGATSILSRRWRYLWTLSPTLDLDGTEFIFIERPRVQLYTLEIRMSRREFGRWLESVEKKRREYVSWVDRVVGCSTAERLVKFRVSFDLTSKHATHIDGWLHFAVSRKVERLELNLPRRTVFCDCYNFPYGKGNFPDGLKMMKKLLLHNVNVSGEALEFFLGNCPLLEHLTVSDSCRLTALQITRTFPSFKCLEISFCDHLDSLVIRDSDLVTLKYTGMWILDFQLLNAPLLTQLWIWAPPPLRWSPQASGLSSMVKVAFQVTEETKTFLSASARLLETKTFLSASASNLKQLEVTISVLRQDDPTLLPLLNLISASVPCIQRFVVEVQQYEGGKYDNLFGTRKYNLKFDRRVYPHLNEVEFVGYRTKDMVRELIMHFVEKDVALETIVVDPRCYETSFVDLRTVF